MAFFFAARMMSLYVMGVMGVLGAFRVVSSVVSALVGGRVTSWGRGESVRNNGLLRFLTSEKVLETSLSNCVGVLGVLAELSSSDGVLSLSCFGASNEYVLPLAYGSMLKKVGLFLTNNSSANRLPFLCCCTGDATELAGVSGRSTGEVTEDAVLDRVRVAMEFGEIDRRLRSVRSTMEGLPEYTTATTRAVSSWLVLRVGDNGSSLLES